MICAFFSVCGVGTALKKEMNKQDLTVFQIKFHFMKYF